MTTPTTISFAGLLPILLRRKRLLLLSGVLFAGVAFTGSRILPLQYSGEGSLIIDNRSTSSSESSSSQTVLTEVDVLQSKGLIRRSVSEFHLDTLPDLEPRFRLPDSIKQPLVSARDGLFVLWQSINSKPHSDTETEKVAGYIWRHIKVVAKEKSYVIQVQFDGGSPTTAARVANAIMGTYLNAIQAAQQDRVAKADTWIAEQTALHRTDVDEAEQRVTQFVQVHNLPEVQGSLTAAIQLSKGQEQLVLAREDLAKAQAGLDSVKKNGTVSNSATIEDKTVQVLRELDARTSALLSTLTPIDPRRVALENQLGSIRSQLGSQKELVFASLTRELQIARARVEALEDNVRSESEVAQSSSVAGASLKQLISDLDAKRQLYVSFLTEAGQARIAAAQAPTAHMLFGALPPERPANAMGVLSLIIGFIGGVAGAGACVVLRGMFGTRINNADEMALATGLRTFGSLPDFKSRQRLSMHTLPPIAETFRAMWMTIRPQQDQASTILVTSSETGEGKTTIAMALAQRFAEDGFRVLLIDSDLRHPRLSQLFEPGTRQYLEMVLSNEVPLERAVMTVRTNLDCLLTRGGENPVRVLSSDRFGQMLTLSRTIYDFVILDSPPALHVADPVLLGKYCEHIIFVVQAGRLPYALVAEALRRFSADDRAKMVTLLTRVKRSLMDRRDYYSGYTTVAP
jgi:polysaccharide biosynthesis transport protein